MKKVLITGGAGFIGSHLTEKLLKKGEEVYILDDLSTGNLENILHLMDNPNFHYVLGSIMDENQVDKLIKECAEIYHLAAAVGVKLIFEQPVKTIKNNVRGTEHILNSALKYGRKVLIASTSEVYGKDIRTGSPSFKETDDISMGTSLRWSYGCSKALDEYLTLAYHKEMGLPAVIVRIFNTVGPRQTGAYGMVIPSFVGQALSGKAITIYGDGKQVRSFIWVGDTVKAMIELMGHPKAMGETFNIGNEEAFSITDLALKIKEKTHSDSKLIYIPYDEIYGSDFEDIRYRIPDINKIKSLIKFTPSLKLGQILDNVIEDYKKRCED